MASRKKYDPVSVAKKAKRKEFFDKGGTPRQWSGGNKKHNDERKQSQKDACRGSSATRDE